MARVAGTDVLRVNIRGAGRAARDLDRVARGLQDDINAELRAYGLEAEAVYRDHAPKDTDQLQGNIRAVPFFRTIRPRLRVVVEPLEGHGGDGRDYLAVTRRGHRKKKIAPRHRKALKVYVMGHRNPHIFVFRANVKGVSGINDWVSRADPQLQGLEANMERRLGRRIERRIVR